MFWYPGNEACMPSSSQGEIYDHKVGEQLNTLLLPPSFTFKARKRE